MGTGSAGRLLDTVKSRSDITIIAEQAANSERAKGMQVMEDWIQTFPKIDAVVSANDQMALGAMEALKGANRLKGVLIAGVDGNLEACQAIKSGEMALSVYQSAPALAKATYEAIKKIQQGSTLKEIIVPHENIFIDNVDEYLK
jgi:inositol transport system substrate-binding protein